MRGRLVGHHVWDDAAPDELGVDVRRVADQPDRLRDLLSLRFFDQRHRLFECINHRVDVANGPAAFGAFGVDFHDEADTLIHRDRQRLRAAHPAEAGC